MGAPQGPEARLLPHVTLLAPAPDPSRPWWIDDLASRGDALAVVTASRRWTYEELDGAVGRVADRLGSPRRLVAIEAANTAESLVGYLGALRGGHPALLLPPGGGSGLLETYDPDVLLGAATGWEPASQRTGTAHELHDDLALLLSTSGSTGSPKLVRLSAANLSSNAAAIAEYLALGPDDRAITTLPMQYCYGLSVLNSHLHAGAAVVMTELSVVDRCFWDLFRASGATSLAGVPHTFDLLDRAGFPSMQLPSLRYLTQAGGRMPPQVIRRYAELGARQGWDLFVMYGQTEATARMAYLPPELAAARADAIGRPIPGGTFTIDAPDDRGVGELVYAGPNVMLGYAEGPEDLAAGASVEQLRTGDLARRADDGLYEIVGRRTRFIKPFGLRIDLDRLERLLAADGVTAMCTGDDHGLVVGVTSAGSGGADAAVAAHVPLPRTHVAVLVLEELPRLASGKPDHAALRALAATADRASPASVHDLFARLFGVPVSDHDTFVSLGGDSLSYVEMSIRLEDLLGALPRGWHHTPVGELAPAERRDQRSVATDTTVLLRAVAITMVVATHADLWHVPGGSHALLAIAGFNFGRFQSSTRAAVSGIARILVPSVCWIGVVAALSGRYGWPNALLLNGLVDRPGDRWGYWFIEALAQILIAVTAVRALPAARRLDERHPLALPALVTAAGLLVRFDLVELTTGHRTSRPHEVLWLFGLGWAAARAGHAWQRLVITLMGAIALHGWFGDLDRELIVLAGLAATSWVPTVAVPPLARRAAAAVAGASLYIYLTHYQVYPVVQRLLGPAPAVVASLLAGIATCRLTAPLVERSRLQR